MTAPPSDSPFTAPCYVVDTSHSPFARLRPIDLRSVQLTDSFWGPRRAQVHEVALPAQYRLLQETGRLDNFRKAAGLMAGPFEGRVFNDSDVYKWLEATSWILATTPDAMLQSDVDDTIALVAAAQFDDGYLDTYFMGERAGERWTDLKWAHEMYCAGHLIQAAVAHHRATGSLALLQVARRFADNIVRTFNPDGRRGADGHPEIEMALVELDRETEDSRYLHEAEFLIDERGQNPPAISGEAYAQDHAPVRQQHEVVGHAVRALYLYAGVTDVYMETGDESLWTILDDLWRDLHAHKIYITGGVGSRHKDEAVGEAYELPNRRAYAETCAAIANVMWNWRMLLATGDARFGDAMETSLYNGVLSGISLEGDRYFYDNPLADRGTHRRQPWFSVSCCPPNVARLLASLPGYMYTTSGDALWVHLYASSTVTAQLPNAGEVTLRQRTNYPWDGEVTIEIGLADPAEFALMVRVPGWCAGASVQVNGEDPSGPLAAGSYTPLRRRWQAGDTVTLHLPMPVQFIASHPHVLNNRDRVAITRGPLVYCLEGPDNPDVDVWDLMLDTQAPWDPTFEPSLLGGIVVLRGSGFAPATPERRRPLYTRYARSTDQLRPISITAIPYYSWANREAGAMQVWAPVAP